MYYLLLHCLYLLLHFFSLVSRLKIVQKIIIINTIRDVQVMEEERWRKLLPTGAKCFNPVLITDICLLVLAVVNRILNDNKGEFNRLFEFTNFVIVVLVR